MITNVWYVQKANPKDTFEKEYSPKWSDEIFSIDRVLHRNPVVYNIKEVLQSMPIFMKRSYKKLAQNERVFRYTFK